MQEELLWDRVLVFGLKESGFGRDPPLYISLFRSFQLRVRDKRKS